MKTFRLFISSTFSDLKNERDILQTKVFPKIEELCIKSGYQFQPIDLRWGVNEEAQLNQQTLALCLEEVRMCKEHSAPNFLIMVGDRYGWIPLPHAIEQNEFETLFSKCELQDKEILQQWYQLDLNELPASYLLKSRTMDDVLWESIEESLRKALQKGAKKAFGCNFGDDGIMNILKSIGKKILIKKDAAKYVTSCQKYFFSATEAEAEEGITPYLLPTPFQQGLLRKNPKLQEIDTDTIFGLFRKIEPKSYEKSNPYFLTKDDTERANAFKKRLKSSLNPENIYEVTTSLSSSNQLDDESYLLEFENRVFSFLETKIDQCAISFTQHSSSTLEHEKSMQASFLEDKLSNFRLTISLQEATDKILEYLENDKTPVPPMVLHGSSGSGKSALMAYSIRKSSKIHELEPTVYRFIGATPSSNTTKYILISIFEELGVDILSEQDKKILLWKQEGHLYDPSKEEPDDLIQFSNRIKNILEKYTGKLYLFIDAVDQLDNNDTFNWLPKQLPSSVKMVISVLDDPNFPQHHQKFIALKAQNPILLPIPQYESPCVLLQDILSKVHRTVQPDQMKYFLNQFEFSPKPLYVTIAAQIMRHWKRDATIDQDHEKYYLANTQNELIRQFIDYLVSHSYHEKQFIQKVFGYLIASKNGLSEKELIQLLSTDKEFIKMMAPETRHENKNYSLPLIHWSRLHSQLKPFLRYRLDEGQILISLFHREFLDKILTIDEQKIEHLALIEACKKMIEDMQGKDFNTSRYMSLYIDTITLYLYRHGQEEDLKKYIRFILNCKDEHLKYFFFQMLAGEANECKRSQKFTEAIFYFRELYYYYKSLRDYDEDFADHYANILNPFSTLLNDHLQKEEAVTYAKEGYKYFKPLRNRNQNFANYYFNILLKLSDLLNTPADKEEAIGYLKEGYDFFKPLRNHNDSFANNYYNILLKLSDLLNTPAHKEEAIGYLKEGYDFFKPLRNHNEGFANDYYNILNQLSHLLNTPEHKEEAIGYLKEGYDYFKSLGDNRQNFANHYVRILYKLSNLLNTPAHKEEAIGYLKEGYDYFKPTRDNGQNFANYYFNILLKLSDLLNTPADKEEAIGYLKEGYDYFKPTRDNGQNFANNYLNILNQLSNLLNTPADKEEAIGYLKEGYDYFKPTRDNGQNFANNYFNILNQLSYVLNTPEHKEEAIGYLKEGYDYFKSLGDNGQNFANHYYNILYKLSHLLNTPAHKEEAIGYLKEGYDFFKPLRNHNEGFANHYYNILNQLSHLLNTPAHKEEAIGYLKEGYDFFKPLRNHNDSFANHYFNILNQLSNLLNTPAHKEEAIGYLKEGCSFFKNPCNDNVRFIENYGTLLELLTRVYEKNHQE